MKSRRALGEVSRFLLADVAEQKDCVGWQGMPLLLPPHSGRQGAGRGLKNRVFRGRICLLRAPAPPSRGAGAEAGAWIERRSPARESTPEPWPDTDSDGEDRAVGNIGAINVG